MKRLTFIFVLGILTSLSTNAGYRYSSVISYDIFYESLAPFGEWIEIDYDLIVWKPHNTGRYWAPYKKGQWLWTSDGWYWDSYEPFGWATYHYGRWHFDDYYGWIWFPGKRWAPAWVEWRYSDEYVGWAPLGPYAKFKIGFGIRFTTKYSHHYNHWHFISIKRFHGYDVNHYVVHHSRNRRLLETTKYRTNYYKRSGRIINGGVNRSFVERRSGIRISERSIVTTKRHFNRNDRVYRDKRKIDVYRPDLTKRSSREVNVNVTRSKRSINLEKSKITTGRKINTSDSFKKRSDSRYTSERRSSQRSVSTSRSRENTIERNSENRRISTDMYNKNISETKRHSRKSSGRSGKVIRESDRENIPRTSRQNSNRQKPSSRRR